MRALGNLALGFFGALAAFALLSVLDVEWPTRMQPLSGGLQVEMTYVDFLTVMFAGATLVLAALALVVGLVAIFTYQGIKDEARRTIQKAVDERLTELDERIEKEVGEEAREKIARAVNRAERSGTLIEAVNRVLLSMGTGVSGSSVSDELDEDEDR